MPTRLTGIFQVTTYPSDTASADAHSGGWSESIWALGTGFTINDAGWQNFLRARARMLPDGATIVGYRISTFDISKNKLIPRGASSGSIRFPGFTAYNTDLPQVSLEMSVASQGAPNTARPVARCIPDVQMTNGEYQPDSTYKGFVTQWCNSLVNPGNFGFIGRDLSQPAMRVLSIAGNVITVEPAGPMPTATDYVILHRVKDNNGNPVKGSFLVTAATTTTITVAGLNANVAMPSGTLRRDLLQFQFAASMVPVRAVVKKVGRPSQGYRGRRSKRVA